MSYKGRALRISDAQICILKWCNSPHQVSKKISKKRCAVNINEAGSQFFFSALGAVRLCAIQIYCWHWHFEWAISPGPLLRPTVIVVTDGHRFSVCADLIQHRFTDATPTPTCAETESLTLGRNLIDPLTEVV